MLNIMCYAADHVLQQSIKQHTIYFTGKETKITHLFVNIALKTRLKYTNWTEKTFYTVKKTSYIESMPCT